MPAHLLPILAESFDLYRRGFIEKRPTDFGDKTNAMLGMDEIDPACMHLSPLGKQLHDVIGLKLITPTDQTFQETLTAYRSLALCEN